jgi:hypothetical protein
MNSNKKPTPARGLPQPFNKGPVAPAVYRPQPLPKVLQTKTSSSASQHRDQAQRQPVALRGIHSGVAKIAQLKVIAPQRRAATPPPVYRPEQKRVGQPKLASTEPGRAAKNFPTNRAQPRSTVQAKGVAARGSLQATRGPGAPSPRQTIPHHRQTGVPAHNVAQASWGWGAVGALALGAATSLMTGGVGLVAAGAAVAGGYLAHHVSDWYAQRPGEEFAPHNYGTNDIEPVHQPHFTDNQFAAVTVDLMPESQGTPFRSGSFFDPEPIRDIRYLPSEVHVRSILVGRGRLDTGRTGQKQGAHTYAWTAFTLSLERLAGRTLAEAATELFVLTESVASHPQQNPKCLEKIRTIRLNLAPNFGRARMGIDQWQRFFSGLLRTYIEAYQLSKEATHIKPGIHGSGSPQRENLYRNYLIEAEENMRSTGDAGSSAATVANWAAKLIDVSFAESLGKSGYARAVHGWLTGMNRSFPLLMEDMGTTIENKVLNVPLAPSWQEPGVTTVRHLYMRYAWS